MPKNQDKILRESFQKAPKDWQTRSGGWERANRTSVKINKSDYCETKRTFHQIFTFDFQSVSYKHGIYLTLLQLLSGSDTQFVAHVPKTFFSNQNNEFISICLVHQLIKIILIHNLY